MIGKKNNVYSDRNSKLLILVLWVSVWVSHHYLKRQLLLLNLVMEIRYKWKSLAVAIMVATDCIW